jgi:anaerobic sulfatase-maturating enzyme
MATSITDDFQIFIKPVGARCNLRCSYCYYLSKSGVCGSDSNAILDDATLENYIKQHFLASSADTVLFTWHGGEPLLAGIDFYKRVVAIQKKYLPSGKRFLNGIQTNGTLITNEWCVFFAENGFSVGISLDGPEVYHNFSRHTHGSPSDKEISNGSFEKVFRGHHLLCEHGINPEILCVVNSYNVKNPLDVYRFFKMIGTQYLTFLPLVVRDDDSPSKVSKESVPSLEFGVFLSDIFDEWVKNDIGIIKIQIIEEALRTAFDQEHSLCIFRKKCGGVPVVERNGDFYSCDHFVDKNHIIGNVNDNSLAHLLNHPDQIAFGEIKQNTLPQYCINCEVREMCNGECPKNRFITSPDGEPGLNYLCEGYKYFFNHCKPFINTVSEAWKQ